VHIIPHGGLSYALLFARDDSAVTIPPTLRTKTRAPATRQKSIHLQ
jgi:hypothetical protein